VILYPAIDLKDGRCVRLAQGDFARVTIYSEDPAAQARRFEALGFPWLHVVDLDGALGGKAVNKDAIESILTAVKIPLQLGGGIRTLGAIEAWLALGVARVILGTAAIRDPALLDEATRAFPGRVAVGIDARGGKIAIDGWKTLTDLGAEDFARRADQAGAAAIIYTDIERDGLRTGLNIDSTLALAECVRCPVIASGGFASLDDLRRLVSAGRRVSGAILGRALYEGSVDARAALELVRDEPPPC
jgi:phosphoribosylformimino-5-aminoimidazole carboxamide ribotide isomerase